MIKEFRDFILRGEPHRARGRIRDGVCVRGADRLARRRPHPGEPDFSALDFTINDAVFRYGAFLTALITFLTTAVALFFFVVKPVNAIMTRVRKPDEEEVTDEERRHRELLAALERTR